MIGTEGGGGVPRQSQPPNLLKGVSERPQNDHFFVYKESRRVWGSMGEYERASISNN